jgi:hypothetical protein
MITGRGLLVLAVALSIGWITGGVGLAAPGDPGTPPISVVPGDSVGTSTRPPSVDVAVRHAAPGDRPAAGGPGGKAAGSGCGWVAAPEMEGWIRRLPARLPAGGEDRIDPGSRLYSRVCGGVLLGYAWLSPAASGVSALPAPGELAREAYAQLRLPVPTPEHSPDLRLADGRAAVLVGEQTWLWTDRSRFRARSRRLQVGPVWAQVTATPVGLSFDPGDGGPVVSCAGPGTAFVPGRDPAHAASPTCGYQYSRSSAGEPGGVVTAAYGITWRVRWTGSTGTAAAGGQLPEMTSRTTTAFAVAEAQALGTVRVRR